MSTKPLDQVLADARGELPDAALWRLVVRQQLTAPPDAWVTVYGLYDPRVPARLRYIGVTRSAARRYAEHALKGDFRIAAWTRELRDAGVPLGMRVLQRCARPVDAFRAEVRLIALRRQRGECDLNSTLASFAWAQEAPAGMAGWPTPPAWALEVVS